MTDRMGDSDDLGMVDDIPLGLDDRFEADAGIAERRRDKAEDAGLIIHQQAHVVRRLRLFQRAETLLLIAGAAHAPKGIIDDIAGDIDDICDNS